MARDFKVGIEVGSDVKNATKNLSKLEKQIGLTKGQMVAMGAAFAAVGAVIIAGTMKAVNAAAFQEAQQNALAAAMENAGTFTEEAYQNNLNYAASLQKMTIFGDEAILTVQRMLTNFGIEGEELKALTKATLDLAVAKKMDLSAAADLVSKSVGSTTNALTRYGITVEGAVGSTERINMAVKNIAKLFGGSAQAQTQTFTGQMEQLKNAIGDTWESIGMLLIPSLTKLVKEITPIVEDFTNWIKETQALQKAVDSVVEFLTTMINVIQSLSKVTDTFVAKGLKKGLIAQFKILATPVSVAAKLFKALTGQTKEASDAIEENAKVVENAYKGKVAAAQNAQNIEFGLMEANLSFVQEKLLEEQMLKSEFDMQDQMNTLFMFDYKKGLTEEYYDWNAEKLNQQFAKQKLFTDQIKILHKGMQTALTSGFAASMKDMLDNGANFAKVMTTISNAVRDVFINMSAEIAAKWVLSHGLMTAATLAWKGITLIANAAVAATSAAVSAFKVIPFPFNFAAAAAAAYGAKSMIEGFFATGVKGFGGGLAMVGERGPEVVRLPGGSNVYNKSESDNILGRTASGVNKVINLSVSFANNTFLGNQDDTVDMITSEIMTNLRLQSNV